jgi:hypothetical protein
MLRRLTTALAAGSLAVPAGAQPTTLTFDEFAITPGVASQALPAPYTTQGYTFGCVNAATGAPCTSLTTFGTTHAAYTGSPALFNNNTFGMTTLARQDGGTFNLLSVDLARWNTASGAVGPVVFEGTLVGGSTVTQTITFGGSLGVLTTFNFSDSFQDLTAVRYHGGGFTSSPTVVAPIADNFVVAASTVPEPSAYALLGFGLLAVGGIAARRQRTTV